MASLESISVNKTVVALENEIQNLPPLPPLVYIMGGTSTRMHQLRVRKERFRWYRIEVL